jgi:AraC-like DNA-binding protein
MSWRRYNAYLAFLNATRTDGAVFDPSWIRNALIAIGAMAVVWSGFFVADLVDPSRNYFDRFWMYVGLSLLAIYLGVEGWRTAQLPYPAMATAAAPLPTPPPAEPSPQRDWSAQAAIWAQEVDAKELWRDPEITLADLARLLATNTTYLSRALNEGLGMTFSTFINSRRVKAVQDKLADASVTDDILTIALAAGFNSKASFNRAFAEIAGSTPSAYRKAARLKG